MEKNPEFIEQRIRWAASKHGVPGGGTSFVEDATEKASGLLRRIPANSHIGRPILIFTADGDDWTVVGLRGIGGVLDGQWREVQYAEISELNGFLESDHGPVPHKRDLDTLEVTSCNGKVRFRTLPGENLFTLWNVGRKAVTLSK